MHNALPARVNDGALTAIDLCCGAGGWACAAAISASPFPSLPQQAKEQP